MEKLVLLSEFLNKYEADLVKGILDSNGIKSFLNAPDRHRPNLAFGSTLKLMVFEKDFKKAKKLLPKYDATKEKSVYANKSSIADYIKSRWIGRVINMIFMASGFYIFLYSSEQNAKIVGGFIIILFIGMWVMMEMSTSKKISIIKESENKH